MAEERTLEETSSWAVSIVCFILIFVSIFIEHLLDLLSKYFDKKRRRALIKALDKIKSELMMLGFISLLLTVSEKPIASICIPKSVGESFLPCGSIDPSKESKEEAICAEKGKMSLMSRSGVRELQFLIFVLASFHSVSSILIFGLGMAKMRRFKPWEAETRTLEYQCSKDPRRFQFSHQTSFGRRHLKYWSEHRILRWPTCFIRQFYESVSKVDYLTLRHGFIMAHFEQQTNFDFQKYIRRALERDFGLVVGTRIWIWMFSMLFIFFNAQKFHSYYWLPFIPLVMSLVIGTKLQSIITLMCLESHWKSHVVMGTLLVRPSDHFFWFGKPKLLLHLIHFILFQNSFQLAFFTWTWFKFGLNSCYHDETKDIVIIVVMGLLVFFLCGYVTLPLYALVTQMGTTMREDVFTEIVVNGLKRWQYRAKKTLKGGGSSSTKRRTRVCPDTSSVKNSPSVSVDASSAVVKVDSKTSNKEHVAIEVGNEENDNEKQSQDHQKKDSVEGFDASNATPSASEKHSDS